MSDARRVNVLVIADPTDVSTLDTAVDSPRWNLIWAIIPYRDLAKSRKVIEQLLIKHDVKFIMYTRNDQISTREKISPITNALRVGYTSCSGIDSKCWTNQMRSCYMDFVTCKGKLRWDSNYSQVTKHRCSIGTSFSLIFDVEQIPDAVYGLPRILKLLDNYDVRATFFVTGIMNRVFPDLLNELRRMGHEIGIHGRWHESMSSLPLDDQKSAIGQMIEDFNGSPVGANFIGRMDINTIQAMIKKGVRYFVFPRINHYRFVSYPRKSLRPMRIRDVDKSIRMMPITCETYGNPWNTTRNMLHSALKKNPCHHNHLSILCHPFRDGNLQNLPSTRKLLDYLVEERRMTPVALQNLCSSAVEETDLKHVHRGSLEGTTTWRDSLPRSTEDISGLLSQNLISLCKLARTNHQLW